MTESLYYLTLSYLHKNQQLINFTKLNHQTTADMIKIIGDKNHLSSVLKCRLVNNWWAIYSYLVRYYPTSKLIDFYFADRTIDTTNLESYIENVYICNTKECIYDSVAGGFFYIKNISRYGYTILNKRKLIFVYDNEFFDSLPKDLIEWVVKHNYLSNLTFIYRELLQKE